MKMSWQKILQMWDANHQDDVLWGKGIIDMVGAEMAATEQDEGLERKSDAEGVSLETLIHAVLMQPGGPMKLEECQQLQPGK
jgi:hypothetical protein